MKRAAQVSARTILAIPVGDVVPFPGHITFLVLDKSGFRHKTVDQAMASDRMLLLVSDCSEAKADPQVSDLAHFGTIGRITEIETLANGSSRVRVDGKTRGKILQLKRRDGAFEARVHPVQQRSGKLGPQAAKTLDYALDLFYLYQEYTEADLYGSSLHCVTHPGDNHEMLCDIVAGNLGNAVARVKRQRLLETLSPLRRINLLGQVLREQIQEFARHPELQKKVQAQRKLVREQADQTRGEEEAKIASKLEKLKKELIIFLASPSPPKSPAQVVAELPVIAIRDRVVLPFLETRFFVGREASLAALNQALAADKRIFLATQHNADAEAPTAKEIYYIGTIAKVTDVRKLPDGNVLVVVDGVQTGRALRVVKRRGYFQGKIQADSEWKKPAAAIAALKDTWELVQDHCLNTRDQQMLLELLSKGGPLECIRKAMDMIIAVRKS